MSLTREEFTQLVGTYEAQAYDHGYCEGCASYDDEGLSGAKRTAGRAESRMKATGAALLAVFDALAAERDAALKRCDKLEAYVRLDSLPPDPRIEAWRAMDSFDVAQLLHRMRAEAERRAGYTDDKGAAAWTAAADALEALTEPRP